MLMLAFLIALGVMAFFAVTLYKKKLLLFKKNELADDTVSFHDNIVSFSNPVLEHKVKNSLIGNIHVLGRAY